MFEFYAVAEPDPVKAEAIIRAILAVTTNELVKAVGPLSAEEIVALGLSPGKFSHL